MKRSHSPSCSSLYSCIGTDRNPNELDKAPNELVINPNELNKNRDELDKNPNESHKNLTDVNTNPNELDKNPNELDKKPKAKRARVKKGPKSDKDGANGSSKTGRSSIYRGVTRHRWTGRFEAHLWDKGTWCTEQNKKGRQIYLGAHNEEDAAARTYDLAALKFWGPGATLNFALENYTNDIEAMEKLTKEEYLATLRRQSSGFSRGVSKYRGVARHHHNGRWEARIGRVFGNKYLYLGTYKTEEEAAAAYDLAAIEYRGAKAVTNFNASVYAERLKEKKTELAHNQSQTLETISPCLSEQQQQEVCDKQHEQGEQEEEAAQQVLFQPQDLNSDISCALHLEEHNEHSWSLCMDTEFHPLPIPDLSNGRGTDLPDLFGETGFQDDIKFVFDGPMDESLMFDPDIFFEKSAVEEEEKMEAIDNKEMAPPLTPSSSLPSSSTTTLVYCN